MGNYEQFDTLMKSGLGFVYDEQFQLARNSFFQALSIDPTNWEATVLASITDACLICDYGNEDQSIRLLGNVVDKIVSEGHRLNENYNNIANMVYLISGCVVTAANYITRILFKDAEYHLSIRYGLRWFKSTYYPLAERLGGSLLYLGDNIFSLVNRKDGKSTAVGLWHEGTKILGICKDQGLFKRISVSRKIRRYERKAWWYDNGLIKGVIKGIVLILVIVVLLVIVKSFR